jgi:hypothetical protein
MPIGRLILLEAVRERLRGAADRLDPRLLTPPQPCLTPRRYLVTKLQILKRAGNKRQLSQVFATIAMFGPGIGCPKLGRMRFRMNASN